MTTVSSTDRVKALISKKDAIEAEIKELMDVLKSQKEVGLDAPLIDSEQFPRADIDVYTVRHARHQISCLQNDHKSLMKEIEEGLHEIHASARTQLAHEETQPSQTTIPPAEGFLLVEQVDSASPAADAGMKVGDKITQFGSVTKKNFESLIDIAQVARHSIDKTITVSLLREDREQRLSLTPRNWSGQGLLGCKVVPLNS